MVLSADPTIILADHSLRGDDHQMLPGGTGPVLRPRGIDSLQGNMGPEYRIHATQDQNRRALKTRSIHYLGNRYEPTFFVLITEKVATSNASAAD